MARRIGRTVLLLMLLAVCGISSSTLTPPADAWTGPPGLGALRMVVAASQPTSTEGAPGVPADISITSIAGFNTSTSPKFRGWPNGNVASSNVSRRDIHELLP